MQFRGKSICCTSDLDRSQQEFVYREVRWLKHAYQQQGTPSVNDAGEENPSLNNYRIHNLDITAHLIFEENSTRTKTAFRAAAEFHKIDHSMLDASSFQTQDNIMDTIKMLCGYSMHQSIFVLRTKLEGVCTAMRDVIGEYCDKMGLPRASFINAGDGKHEHPTQEFLDEFTFLEHNGWDRASMHIALVGDLLHGRTVHSKVEGLRIYDKVRVDLVAPAELAMPSLYVDAMRRYGFVVRHFASIDEYTEQCGRDGVAPVWYFTRLQIERMGEDVIAKEAMLRRAITFREELYERVDAQRTKFYHPLPRHAKYPEIPPYLDSTPLNGWEHQSMNGYFTRIVELAMLAGLFDDPNSGSSYATLAGSGTSLLSPMDVSYIREISPHRASSTNRKDVEDSLKAESSAGHASMKDATRLHIKQISNGVVIDHIGRMLDRSEAIWSQMDNIHRVLGLYGIGSEGVFPSNNSKAGLKGLMSFPDVAIDNFTPPRRKMLAAIAPGCTLNVIQNSSVVRKFLMDIPPRIYNFPQMSCLNPDCVSNHRNSQNVVVYFERSHDLTYRCRYCDWEHLFSEIWSTEDS